MRLSSYAVAAIAVLPPLLSAATHRRGEAQIRVAEGGRRTALMAAQTWGSVSRPSAETPWGALAEQPGACRWDSITVNSVRDIFVSVVTADTDDDSADSARSRLQLPKTVEDSVVRVTNATLCNRALSAYRIQKFGADTGWLHKVALFRIHDRYGVYGGELRRTGPIVLTFDLSWNYKGRY